MLSIQLPKLVAKTLENGRQLVSYSPRRLAKSFYCGAGGYHDRYSPGAPTTGGMEFGLKVDKNISAFVNDKLQANGVSRELEYYLFNTPKLTPEAQAGVELIHQFEIPNTNFTVLLMGIADVIYESRVVEIKTGKAKDWHRIQALCYACITNKPCQIIYVTRGFSVFVEPDWEELLRIVRTSLDNEVGKAYQKCEHCAFCGIKPMCSEFNSNNDYIRVLCSLRSLVDSCTDKQEAKEYRAMLKKLIRQSTGKLLLDHLYTYNGYTVRTRSSKALPGQISSMIFRKRNLDSDTI